MKDKQTTTSKSVVKCTFMFYVTFFSFRYETNYISYVWSPENKTLYVK